MEQSSDICVNHESVDCASCGPVPKCHMHYIRDTHTLDYIRQHHTLPHRQIFLEPSRVPQRGARLCEAHFQSSLGTPWRLTGDPFPFVTKEFCGPAFLKVSERPWTPLSERPIVEKKDGSSQKRKRKRRKVTKSKKEVAGEDRSATNPETKSNRLPRRERTILRHLKEKKWNLLDEGKGRCVFLCLLLKFFIKLLSYISIQFIIDIELFEKEGEEGIREILLLLLKEVKNANEQESEIKEKQSGFTLEEITKAGNLKFWTGLLDKEYVLKYYVRPVEEWLSKNRRTLKSDVPLEDRVFWVLAYAFRDLSFKDIWTMETLRKNSIQRIHTPADASDPQVLECCTQKLDPISCR
jgi:hypothetical protein